MLVAGAIILISLVLTAVFAPWLAPQDPYKVNLSQRTRPGWWSPDGVAGFPLGTDHMGRDVLSRVLYGGRISLTAGLGAVILASVAGLFFGCAGFLMPWIDNLLMRIMDMLFAFPAMLLAMTILAVIGPGLINAALAIALVDIPRVARVVRGQVLQIKEQDYIEASRALGAGRLRSLLSHVVPNVLPTLLVYGSLLAGRAILTIAGLSYLGLGARPPMPEWGAMLSEARQLMLIGAWWGVLLPGFAILLAVLSFNMLGDAVRDVLDPRLR
jgi:ABC-type dipeptide/oligopeptide/nickel transport system permease subunit